ncbi:hypothetical protein [Xanthocytophaga agilis]|uniref:Uncharacterized protein n=1 Tax=Xanthocytophaga agilis TaxID=3048010 RepID=A0AAE3R189_9BACT|nr:hypothetical protein [Xanthocytophaga agilis]MDJ1501260.1 hypothetical protein [Xanthocytophaga agilis]
MYKYIALCFVLTCLTGCQTPDRIDLSCANIIRIEVENRGLFGDDHNDRRVISSKDSIQQICGILINSKKIRFKDFNGKANSGLCDIYLYYKNGNSHWFYYTQTIKDGGIVNYSDNFYLRNDELLPYLWYPGAKIPVPDPAL